MLHLLTVTAAVQSGGNWSVECGVGDAPSVATAPLYVTGRRSTGWRPLRTAFVRTHKHSRCGRDGHSRFHLFICDGGGRGKACDVGTGRSATMTAVASYIR